MASAVLNAGSNRSSSPQERAQSTETELSRAPTPSTSVQEHARLTLNVQHLFNEEELSDVILKVHCADGTETIYAHRLVLVVASTYFSSALSKQWHPVTAVGASVPETSMHCDEKLIHVRAFLEFLYGREVELTLDCVHPLLRLSDFYGVDKLGELCLDYLERVLHPDPTRCFQLFEVPSPPAPSSAGGTEDHPGNDAAPELAPTALTPQAPAQPRLLALCAEVLARSFSDASAHKEFLSCPAELLVAVLERDDLSVDHEAEVLTSLLQWAAHDSSREAALGEMLDLVRWPLITGETLADIEDSHELLASEAARVPLREHLLDALKFQAASPSRKQAIVSAVPDSARRFRPRTPNMVRLQGEGKFCWSLKSFSRLSTDERIYSPPFTFSGIAFTLLFFPRGNQQREYASLYVSVADKTKLAAGWRREVHFSLCVVDQKETLCSVTKSTHGELSSQVLDWGFTELIALSSLHSSSHGYILDDTLQFTVQFERVTEGSSVRSRPGTHSNPTTGGGRAN